MWAAHSYLTRKHAADCPLVVNGVMVLTRLRWFSRYSASRLFIFTFIDSPKLWWRVYIAVCHSALDGVTVLSRLLAVNQSPFMFTSWGFVSKLPHIYNHCARISSESAFTSPEILNARSLFLCIQTVSCLVWDLLIHRCFVSPLSFSLPFKTFSHLVVHYTTFFLSPFTSVFRHACNFLRHKYIGSWGSRPHLFTDCSVCWCC